jgi:hypothetical protein
MFKVHGFVDDELRIRRQMPSIPRAGDTMRLTEEKYATVTEVIWCMDEPSNEGQRINLRMESLPTDTPANHENKEQ